MGENQRVPWSSTQYWKRKDIGSLENNKHIKLCSLSLFCLGKINFDKEQEWSPNTWYTYMGCKCYEGKEVAKINKQKKSSREQTFKPYIKNSGWKSDFKHGNVVWNRLPERLIENKKKKNNKKRVGRSS